MGDKQFLPEYSFLLSKGRYVPMWRLFVGDQWNYGCRDGKPILCDTSGQAMRAAKEIVQRKLNPKILVAHAETAPPAEPAFLNREVWRQERDERREQERKRFAGAEVLFLKGNRKVVVERRGARA